MTQLGAHNPILKDIRRALTRGALTSDGLCVAETFHLLDEALASGLDVPRVIAAERARAAVEERLERHPATELMVVADEVYTKLSATEAAQGVAALVRPRHWAIDELLPGSALVVVLDGIQDPGNAGAMARAAEAFGATGMLWLKGTVSPWNAKTLRASAGSLFRVPFIEGVDEDTVLEWLNERGVAVYVAVPRGGVEARQADFTRRCALVVGSEGAGVRPALRACGEDVHIATRGVESLNAGVAAGVLLYEASRQRASS
jgi:TrmH family RNA methyltransferase